MWSLGRRNCRKCNAQICTKPNAAEIGTHRQVIDLYRPRAQICTKNNGVGNAGILLDGNAERFLGRFLSSIGLGQASRSTLLGSAVDSDEGLHGLGQRLIQLKVAIALQQIFPTSAQCA